MTLRVILASLLIFQACQHREKDLLNFEKRKLTFLQLPDDVKATYLKELNKQHASDDHIVISNDQGYTIKYDRTGMDDGIWILLTKGFKHYFYINNKHLTLQANQGAPFILSKKKFYYSHELNLDEQKRKNATFAEINLSNELD